jgi:HD-GYP domain-containing protein (c-di-GMP phosphodiesterase class II)
MGLTSEEAKGTGWQQAIHPDDRADVFSRFADAVQHGSVYEGSNRYVRTDGTVVWVDVNAGPIRDGERLVGYVGTVADVTERKQAEEKLHRHLNYLTALRDVDQAIASSFDVHISLNTLISRAVSLLGVDAATVLLMDPVAGSLRYAAGYGFRTNVVHTANVKLGESYAGRAANEQRMIQIPNLANDSNNLFSTGFLKGEDFISYYGVPLIVKGEAIGVLEVFQRKLIDRDEEWFEFLNALAGQAAIAIDHATLFENLKSSNRRPSQAYDATIEGWSRAMDLRDKETEGHTQRVTDMTVRLALAMNINETDIVHIRRGALLHDIGKLGIPDHILLKSDQLTDEEWLIMRQHPVYAFNMLASVYYLHHALEIPYCHHEKWDGSGYPHGLKGLEIPLAARIFAVADVWDAITSDRPYRKGWSKVNALDYIKEQSGKYFDPQVVNVFLKIIDTSESDVS